MPANGLAWAVAAMLAAPSRAGTDGAMALSFEQQLEPSNLNSFEPRVFTARGAACL